MNFVFSHSTFFHSPVFLLLVYTVCAIAIVVIFYGLSYLTIRKKGNETKAFTFGAIAFSGILSVLLFGAQALYYSIFPVYDSSTTITSAQKQINSTYPLFLSKNDVSNLLTGPNNQNVWNSINDGHTVNWFGKIDTVLSDGTIVPIQLLRSKGKYELVTPDTGSGFHELQHKN